MAEANRKKTSAHLYRAGWWAFKLHIYDDCVSPLQSARRLAKQKAVTTVEIDSLLLENAECDQSEDEILAHLEGLVASDPDHSADYWQQWAEVMFRSGYEDQSVAKLKSLIVQPGASISKLESLADMYGQRGEKRKQTAVWQDIYLAAGPIERRQIGSRLVSVWIEQGEPKEALSALMRSVNSETDRVHRRKQFENQVRIATEHQELETQQQHYAAGSKHKLSDPFMTEAMARTHLALGQHDAHSSP